jgi:hypothetical protein
MKRKLKVEAMMLQMFEMSVLKTKRRIRLLKSLLEPTRDMRKLLLSPKIILRRILKLLSEIWELAVMKLGETK